jgi:tRNA-2-methylthio-N6-dimethylallyladenosine synthase
VGQVVEVLVEGPSKASQDREDEGPVTQMTGRTPCDRITVFEGNRRQAGQLLPITIYDAHSHTLFGQAVTREVGPEVYVIQPGTPA